MMKKGFLQRRAIAWSAVITLIIILTIGGIALVNHPTNPSTPLPKPPAPKQKGTDAYASISPDDIQRAGGILEILWNSNTAPIVARVHIDSIDGGRVYNPIDKQYTYPHTVGKMTVLDVYRGTIPSGKQLPYARIGGIVTYDDYWKTLNPQQQDKMLQLNNGQQPEHKPYIDMTPFEDIPIRAGVTYVAFITPRMTADNRIVEYTIDGLQHGLLQSKGNGHDVIVLNNDTKQWQKLSDIISLNEK